MDHVPHVVPTTHHGCVHQQSVTILLVHVGSVAITQVRDHVATSWRRRSRGWPVGRAGRCVSRVHRFTDRRLTVVWRQRRERKKAMRRGVMTLLGLVGCLLCARAVAGAPDRVYTVSQVLTGLRHDPWAWVGRTALVRGTALLLLPGCGATAWCPGGLYEPHTRRPGPILLLEPGPADPLWGRLRRVPILGDVAPHPQHMHDQTLTVYRLRFQAVSHRSCDAHPCVNAVLVDAAPPSTP